MKIDNNLLIKELPVIQGVTQEDFEPYVDSAVKFLALKFSEEVIAQNTERFYRAIANKMLYDAIPQLDLRMTNNGFAVVSAPNLAPASKERVSALRASCYETYNREIEYIFIQMIRSNNVAFKSSQLYQERTCLLFWSIYDFLGIVPNANYDQYESFAREQLINMSAFDEMYTKPMTDILTKRKNKVELDPNELTLLRAFQLALYAYSIAGNFEQALANIDRLLKKSGEYPDFGKSPVKKNRTRTFNM